MKQSAVGQPWSLLSHQHTATPPHKARGRGYPCENNSWRLHMAGQRVSIPLRTLGQEIGKRRPFESAPEEAFLNILRTASVLSNDASRFIKGFGLSEPQ